MIVLYIGGGGSDVRCVGGGMVVLCIVCVCVCVGGGGGGGGGGEGCTYIYLGVRDRKGWEWRNRAN